MDFRIVWTETALADLRDLVRYIARDDRQVAKRFGDLIVNKVLALIVWDGTPSDPIGIDTEPNKHE